MRFRFEIEGRSDAEERDLPTISAAKCEALRYASNVVCEEADKFWDTGTFQMTVSDGNRLTLLTLTIARLRLSASTPIVSTLINSMRRRTTALAIAGTGLLRELSRRAVQR